MIMVLDRFAFEAADVCERLRARGVDAATVQSLHRLFAEIVLAHHAHDAAAEAGDHVTAMLAAAHHTALTAKVVTTLDAIRESLARASKDAS